MKGLKIGYLKKAFDADYPTKANDQATLETLRKLGAELVAFELPDIPVGKMSHILSAEAAASFDELTRSGKDDQLVRQVKNAWPNSFRSARFIPAVEYIQANRIRTKLINEMAQTMKGFDVYITPTYGQRQPDPDQPDRSSVRGSSQRIHCEGLAHQHHLYGAIVR